MRRVFTLAASLALVTLVGCSSSPVVGTWSGRGAANAPFTFGSVSFVGDQTFTAEAKYSGNTRVQSGTWATTGDELSLNAGDSKRNYKYKVEGSTLVVTDPKSGHAITLDRMPK